ncbi:2TM domain-containing protein [uncultured Marixanthomonas sp.]|uniref:2TM domain-containing protein n=1 Tax=uncultured Marixanthomonas sp. TaxID=757245 RepID=UPI0030DCFBCC|tara:strand:- start:39153 stop:40484 length:1332 start_codon:yes stop_codon:yes gene_type:complete
MIRFFKELGKAFFVGSLIFLVLGLIQFATGNTIETGTELLRRFLYNQFYSVTLYMANAYVIMYFLEKFKGALYSRKILWKAVLTNIIVTMATLFLIHFIISVVIKGNTIPDFIAAQNFDFYKVSLIISIVVLIIFYGFFYYKHTQEKRVKEQKIIAGAASAQFDALKNQLDPHFLFNSLNVLTSLIEENPEAATRFTTSLSKVYRYVLEQKNKQLVTIEEELKFAQLYMSLLKMRFEESIVFMVPSQLSNPEAKVVPLSLQLLLENAVKHNQVTPSKKLHIVITEDKGNLLITNNYQPKQVVRESSGVGLKNIRQRYGLLTNRPVEIQQDAKQFRISIPLLTQQTMTVSSQETYISEKKYARAKERVQKLKGFYGNLGMYIIFIPVFIWVNYKSGAGFPWAIFPIAGWGMGVLAHAAETFNYNPFFGKDWEKQKIKELMEEDD